MKGESRMVEVGIMTGMTQVSVVSVKQLNAEAIEVRCVSKSRVPFHFQVGANTPFAKELVCLGIPIRGPVIADFEFGLGGTTIESITPILPQKRASS